jgi:hypothetical protein
MKKHKNYEQQTGKATCHRHVFFNPQVEHANDDTGT